MDQEEIEKEVKLYAEFQNYRALLAANTGNAPVTAIILQKIDQLTVPAPDFGRVLAKNYDWTVPYESGLIHVDTTSYLECEILYRGHYAPLLLRTVKQLLSPGSVAVDIGANIGCITLAMAWQVGPTGKVIAFEPEPECFGRLKQNVLLNRLSQVSLHQLAVSDKDSTHTLHLRAEGSAHRAGASLMRGEEFSREVQVETARVESIRELSELTRCDLIKIDTEGHELVVLKQLRETISRLQPHIIFEYEEHTWSLHNQSYAEAVALMKSLGYTLYAMDNNMVAPISPKVPFGRDILCVPSVLRPNRT